MFIQGIDKSKACVLIALDLMFKDGYFGRDELHELFLEQWNISGVPTRYLKLLEEYAPVYVLRDGNYTFSMVQGEYYFSILNTVTRDRIRVIYSKPVIILYDRGDGIGHAAICTANNVIDFLHGRPIMTLIMPRNELILDKVKG